MHLNRKKRLPKDQEAVVTSPNDARDERVTVKVTRLVIVQVPRYLGKRLNEEVTIVIDRSTRA